MKWLMWTMVGWSAWAWVGADLLARLESFRPSRFAERSSAMVGAGATEVIELLSLSVRRGVSFHAALERCYRFARPETASQLRPCLDALDLGVATAEAVRQAEADPTTPLGVALDALAESVRSGQPLLGELDRVGSDLRRLDSHELAARARRLSVWLTAPLVFFHLPAFFLVAIAPTLVVVLG